MAGAAAVLVLALAGAAYGLGTFNYNPNVNIQNSPPPGQYSESNEQINESLRQEQEAFDKQTDINNREFILVGSSVACSSTEVNGAENKSCSGNIRIVPKADDTIGPGLYKINEQTKLLHAGQEQKLTKLHEISQNQTVVRLTLADGSDELLAEIRY